MPYPKIKTPALLLAGIIAMVCVLPAGAFWSVSIAKVAIGALWIRSLV